ncbi:MAG: glycosyltransferase family 9 protein [Rhodospirillales bacterium]
MIKPYRILDWWLDRKRRGRTRPGPARGVLLLSSGGLGDTVLFAHVAERFAALAKEGEPVTVLLRADAVKMAFLVPPGIEAKGVDFGRLRKDLGYRRQVTDELFDAHYRLVVHTDYLRHPDLDEALVAAARAPEALAMEPRPWRKYDARLRCNRDLYARLYESGPPALDKVVRWSRFADWLTGSQQPPPVARLPKGRLPEGEAVDVPLAVIQPFSAVKRKQSPPDVYRRIIGTLPAGTRVVVTGAAGDMDANPEFKALLDLPGVEFDDSGFRELVPLLRAARLVVSVDTALMHLAVAVGAPTVCLASAAFVGEIVPYDPAVRPPNARFVYHSMPCEGCLGDCILAPEDGMFPCVARLAEDRIMAEVEAMLAEARPT